MMRLVVDRGRLKANQDILSGAFNALRCRCSGKIMTESSLAATRTRGNDFRLGAVIARSASVLWRHLLTFFVVGVLASLPVLLLVKPSAAGPVGPAPLGRWLWEMFAFGLLMTACTLGQAVIIHAAFRDMRRTGTIRLAESLNVSLRQFWPLAALTLAGLLSLLGLLFLVVPGLILSTIWFVGLPSCLAERLGPWRSLRRSQELTKGHRWKVFALTLLLYTAGLGSVFVEPWLFATAGLIGGSVVKLMWSGIWVAFGAVLLVVTYHDLRVAKEGSDIEHVAVVFD
jgi:hypothetical protein